MPKSPALPKNLSTYPALLKNVKTVLIEGQRRIEQEKANIYWETGRLIKAHVLNFKNRADYGREVLLRLANDLGVHKSTLHRCVQFVEKYPRLPIVDRGRQFTWSYFRKLIPIADDRERSVLEEKIQRNNWTAEELAARIKAQKSDGKIEVVEAAVVKAPSQKPLVSLRGTLYTYRLVKRDALGPPTPVKTRSGQAVDLSSELLVDLGFGVFRNIDNRVAANFVENQIVESRPKEESYRFSSGERVAKDLFTYRAYIEKVIDGDTIKVRFDLGFDTWTRQTLRLRGLDCPEMDTSAGKSAKAFIQSLLKDVPMVIVHSSRSDKYDRYLADVFIPSSDGKVEIFLNNLLLQNGHAVRVV